MVDPPFSPDVANPGRPPVERVKAYLQVFWKARPGLLGMDDEGRVIIDWQTPSTPDTHVDALGANYFQWLLAWDQVQQELGAWPAPWGDCNTLDKSN